MCRGLFVLCRGVGVLFEMRRPLVDDDLTGLEALLDAVPRCDSVLPRPFLQGAAPCPFLMTPCLFLKAGHHFMMMMMMMK